MLAQVREPLLAVLRISPDFRPAYDPLLRWRSHRASDPAAARALLVELHDVQAARLEAARRFACSTARSVSQRNVPRALRSTRATSRLAPDCRIRVGQQRFERRPHLGEGSGLARRVRAKSIARQRRLLDRPNFVLRVVRLAVVVAVVDLGR